MLVIDKPPGWTSFDVVARVRRVCGVKRVGHAGTLDPLASGVLPICLGSATRLIDLLAEATKEYRAVVGLGVTSPTDDAEGPLTVQVADPAALPAAVDVAAALARFRGPQEQLPPRYSAVHQDGRRLYDLARRGITVERRPRPVHIYRLELLAYTPPRVHLLVECSKGTYIRSLARDLGELLGCGAYLAGLVRTRHGPFRIEDAAGLPQLEAAAGGCGALLRPVSDLLIGWPRIDVDPETAARLLQGRPLPAPPPAPGAPEQIAAFGPAGQLLALVYWQPARAQWHPAKVFPLNAGARSGER